MQTQVWEQAKYWSENQVFDQDTRTEIGGLIKRSETQELEERFYKDLEFGTGGLRGVLGAGSSRMNIYNVRRASWALGQYILQKEDQEALEHPLAVAVSFDSRRYSKEFAQETARVLAALGIKVFITKELRPVPMLSFMVRHFHCVAGVCITASHNPPEYNGFKVYWKTGGQLVPPHDQGVIDFYKQQHHFEKIALLDYQEAKVEELICELDQELDEPYFQKVLDLPCLETGMKNLKIVYTPIHGTGLHPVQTCLNRLGFHDLHVVLEQAKPDPEFPTVSSPNPEDPQALKRAVELAKEQDADIVLGTDPDCDRIGLVAKHQGEWVFLNGNELGSLLVDFVLKRLKETGQLPQDSLVIKTIVTTELQTKIAHFYGAQIEDTLTGFKWICQLIEDYETGAKTPYRQFICGGEESFGFLAGQFVRDKDAVIACAIASEMAHYYKEKGQSLVDALYALYDQFGCYHEKLHTITLKGKEGEEKIEGIMSRLRQHPPTEICGIKVAEIRDYKTSQIKQTRNQPSSCEATIPLPSSNVLQFILDDESRISARPSGTEPKIKFYVSVHEPVGTRGSSLEQKEICRARAKKLVEYFVGMI